MKRKIIITLIIVLSIILILFTPIPVVNSDIYGEGSATSYNALTYQVVKWDMFPNSLKPYKETETIIFPNNFQSTEKLWEDRYNDLMDDGYGAVLSYAVVTEKYDTGVLVDEVSDNEKTAYHTIDVAKIQFEENGISFDDIEVGTKLKITYDGFIEYIYPGYFGRIYKIELYE